jgi:hypothetical protein
MFAEDMKITEFILGVVIANSVIQTFLIDRLKNQIDSLQNTHQQSLPKIIDNDYKQATTIKDLPLLQDIKDNYVTIPCWYQGKTYSYKLYIK